MIDVIASEWYKLRSLRSNIALLAASVAAVFACGLVAYLMGAGFDRQSADERLAFAGNGNGLATGLPIAYLVMAALGALAITSEYSTGMIRTSLAAVPRRQVFLLAKIPGLATVSLVAGQVLAFAMHLVSQLVLGERADQVLMSGQTLGTPLSEPGVLAATVVAGLSMVAVALIGLGLGAAIRSTPGTLLALVLLLFVLPVGTRVLPSPLRDQAGSIMIENLPSQIAGVGGGLLTPLAAGALLVAYVVAALSAGAVVTALRSGRRRVLAVGTAVTLVSGAVVAAAAPGTAGSSLSWGACTLKPAPQDLRCSSVEVPLDWRNPGGRKITLKLAKLAATGAERRMGTVFLLPGGPGGSGVDDLAHKAGSFAQLRHRFDVVSLAPRNVVEPGGVLPHDCLGSGPWLTLPGTRAEFAALAEANRAHAQRCRDADPAFFDTMDSASVAKDVEAVRVALGEDRMNLLGNSYGGVAAVGYARQFPGRVRTIVLDGSVNHVDADSVTDAEHFRVKEQSMRRFAAWCEGATACALRGQDVPALWRRLLREADRSPVPVKGAAPSLSYSGFDLLVAALPSFGQPGDAPERPRWVQLADAIKRAAEGDARGFADYVYQATKSMKVPSWVGVNMTHCLDGLGYATYEDYREGLRRGRKLSPHFGAMRAWHDLACPGWPVPVANPRAPLPADRLPPLMAVGSWTDYEATAAITRKVPGSGGVAYDGHGHGLYLAGKMCPIAHVNRYFLTGEPPPPGTVCKPSS
ncbi:alpha/beta fold hydrolase [Nonomuraea longicatena]|uniref:Alpha/beta fold hydrolase n=1 Tax=Nonomuraea longicatena TaxID=83682 RepID=A0ABP4AGY8_9ACTN